jgi:LysR family transcriptional regulator, salicylic acid-responsive activator of bsdBCD
MELENYRNFLAVVDIGSITGASEHIHIAQPALSKQLQSLESFFGTRLIITTRGSRRLILTEAGKTLYQKAKYICSLEDSAKSEIEKISGGTIGTLRFSVANSRSANFISRSLKNFNRLYPYITYEIYEAGIYEQIQQLINGITELGILSSPVIKQDVLDLLFQRKEELVAVFHRQSPFLKDCSGEISVERLAGIPLSISAGCKNILDDTCQNKQLGLNILSINTTRHTTLQWAQENTTVAIVLMESNERFNSDFIIKKIKNVKAELFKSVVKVKGRPLSAAAIKFLQFYDSTSNSIRVHNMTDLSDGNIFPNKNVRF